jgi:hypothetical protein
MFRLIAGAMGIIGIICQLVMVTQRAHAEPAAEWTYKGSVVAFSQSGSNVIIAYRTLSDALVKSGAHVGDPLFRGQRDGNALTGKVYRFFGPQCQPMGFGVEGSIEGDTIILRGIAPGLGLNSCKVVTTYYDSLVLTAVAAPAQMQQPLAPRVAGFQPMKAAAAVPAAATSPVYLAFPFRCVMRNGQIVLESTSEPYYHEALDYRPATPFDICPPNMGISACKRFELTGLRLVCQGGMASAPALTLARPAQQIRMVRLYGDALLLPFYTGPGATEGPDNLYQAPAGFGLLPKPTDVISADDFASMYDPVRAKVALPRSFFLTLANWFPVPQLIGAALLCAVIVLAFCGFYILNPQSRLSPKHARFWVFSCAAFLGLFYALTVGRNIHDAYGIGRPAIASPFIRHGGYMEPFSSREAERVRHPRQPQNAVEAKALADDVAMKAYVALLPVLLFLGLYARSIFAGYHYFFVSHPAQEAIKGGLQSGELFDLQKLAPALREKPQEPEKVSLTETLARTAATQALHEQVQADAELADALMRRDRARAMQAEAEAELRRMRAKLPWWKRMLGA